jgi:glutaredoxin
MISRSKRFAHHADWFIVGLYVGLLLGLLMVAMVTSAEVTVYGRNSCGFTANLRTQLDNEGIPYAHCNIDSAGCLGAMFSVALEFNLAVKGTVNLPVVLVVANGQRFGYVRPSLAEILRITSVEVTISPTIAYPNPVGDFINVEGDVVIYDITGKIVIVSHDRHISISALPHGMYIFKVRNKVIKFINNNVMQLNEVAYSTTKVKKNEKQNDNEPAQHLPSILGGDGKTTEQVD